jgi:thioredoxin-dependent peroxiredoxin
VRRLSTDFGTLHRVNRLVSFPSLFVLLPLAFASCKEGGSTQPSGSTETALEAREGHVAPELEFTLQTGARQRLSALQGKFVVLYFYPQDQTRGCTIQAQGMRDSFSQFTAKGAVVIGVSTQDAASHRAFIEAEALPFDLAVDEQGELARAFGVEVSDGRAARDTVLIDPKGVVRRIWRGVSPNDHAALVLAEISKG